MFQLSSPEYEPVVYAVLTTEPTAWDPTSQYMKYQIAVVLRIANTVSETDGFNAQILVSVWGRTSFTNTKLANGSFGVVQFVEVRIKTLFWSLVV